MIKVFGDNPIRSPVKGDGSTLNIQNLFATLQGEGMYAGYPAVFIRLGGCNLACTFCDTEFESFKPLAVAEIVNQVIHLSHSSYTFQSETSQVFSHEIPQSGNGMTSFKWGKRIRHLVVITGGEPFLQPIETLCQALLAAGFKIQIETNGTLYRELPASVDIICSPKHNGKGYFPVRADLLARINALKFIISASNPHYSTIADVGQDPDMPVYVQPMDEYNAQKNQANLKRATELACQYGYRLSLQIHKIIGLE